MRKTLLIVSALLICFTASAGVNAISESKGHILLYFTTANVYGISIKDAEGGEPFVIALYDTPEKTAGALDLMIGILSDIYPDAIGICQGNDFATLMKCTGGLAVEYEGKFGIFDLDTLIIFRNAVMELKH